MSDTTRLRFRGVRKTFRPRNRSDSLRDAIPRAFKRLVGARTEAPKRFVALEDVSFELKSGEVLGIVGANGAGKTTSLRLAAGVFRPDAGVVEVDGRVSALIELSAGFHPDLSGRENIYLVGALLGLRRRDVEEQYDRITEFADIGDFMDAPVRTYSTGMAVRLGFAVAAHVPSELLLIDEVLAVGDINFRDKCLRRMSACRDDGVAMLFVSHDLETVGRFCDRVMFIHHGHVLADGDPRDVIALYRRTLAEEKGVIGPGTRGLRRGSQELRLEQIDIVGEGEGGGPGRVEHLSALHIHARWACETGVSEPRVRVHVVSPRGYQICAAEATHVEGAPTTWQGTGRLTVTFPRVDLLPGSYDLTVEVLDASSLGVYDCHSRLYQFQVVGRGPDGSDGAMHMPATFVADD